MAQHNSVLVVACADRLPAEYPSQLRSIYTSLVGSFPGGRLLLALVFIAEYTVVDVSDARHPASTALLLALSYVLFLILVIALRAASLRLYLMVPAVCFYYRVGQPACVVPAPGRPLVDSLVHRYRINNRPNRCRTALLAINGNTLRIDPAWARICFEWSRSRSRRPAACTPGTWRATHCSGSHLAHRINNLLIVEKLNY